MVKNLDFLRLFYFLKKKTLIDKFYKNNIIILKVLQIQKKNIFFDGNLKSECVIKTKEFLENGILKIKEGDFIEAFLSNIENKHGNIVLSRSKLKKYIFWKNISISHERKIFIKGRILKKIKGGYTVTINNFNCFLPFSCSDKKISNINYYLEKDLYFLILNFDFKKKNIILSRKAILLKIIYVKRKLFFKNVRAGTLIKGIVKNITNYCVFVDIGYLDCIIYFKDLMWGNFKYSNQIFKIGQSILTIILKIDLKKKRVFLGMKQIFNPWRNFKKIKKTIKYVRILRINSYNIYVILAKNIIAAIRNNYKKKIFRLFKVNKYKKIIIERLNYKKKRLEFKFIKNLP